MWQVYPQSVEGSVYEYNVGGYSQTEILEPGNGYWIRFENSGAQDIEGDPLDVLNVEITNGWNLISGSSFEMELSEFYDPDGLLISGTIYGFDEGYISTNFLLPGKGYWVRSTGNGTIFFNR